jgi:pyruvate dehydrogenase complex dehydrogenase (E1) component
MTIEVREPKFKIGQVVYYSNTSDSVYELIVNSIEIHFCRVVKAEGADDKVFFQYHCSSGIYSNTIYEHELSETLEKAIYKKVKVYRLTD